MGEKFDFEKLRKIKAELTISGDKNNKIESKQRNLISKEAKTINNAFHADSTLDDKRKSAINVSLQTIKSIFLGSKKDDPSNIAKLQYLEEDLNKLEFEDFYSTGRATELIKEYFNIEIQFVIHEPDFEELSSPSELMEMITSTDVIETLDEISNDYYYIEQVFSLVEKINNNIVKGNYRIKDDQYSTSLPSVLLMNDLQYFVANDGVDLLKFFTIMLNPAFYNVNSNLSEENQYLSFESSFYTELNRLRTKVTPKFWKDTTSYDLSLFGFLEVMSEIIGEYDTIPVETPIDEIFDRDSETDSVLVEILDQLLEERVYPDTRTFITRILSSLVSSCKNTEECKDILNKVRLDTLSIPKVSYLLQVWATGYICNLPWSILENRDTAE